ncbi:MAG: ISAs1 family transposase [Armatimonadota bacterium]
MTAALSASPPAGPLPVPTRSVSEATVSAGESPKLREYLCQVPDPRQARGKRHPLEAILLLVVVATLAGRTHRQGIHEWGRGAEEPVRRALGFREGKTPAASTLHEVLSALDWTCFAAQLRAWALALLAYLDPEGQAALSCDGKTVKGSLREGSEVAHLLSAFTHDLGITLDLEPVSRKSNEIPAVPKLLLRLPVRGRVVVVDALLTQEEIALGLVAAGADYVMPVKGNQPGLQGALQEIFATALPKSWHPEAVEQYERGHGRRELRRLTLVAPPPGERLDWGRARQYFLLERVRWVSRAGQEQPAERTLVYGITSLERRQAGARELLTLIRSHWQIENRSHWVRDTLLREDESRSANPTLVQVLGGLRCAALTLLHYQQRREGWKSLVSTPK